MLLRRNMNWRKVMVLGMYCLVFGSLARMLPRFTHVSVDVADWVQGLFLGMAIGLLLLSIRMRSHRNPGDRSDV